MVNPQPDTGSAAAEPNPHTPEPDPPIPEPDLLIPEPDPPIPEPDTPIPEPDLPIPKPDSPIPEPVVQLDLQDQTDNSSDEKSSDEESSEDSQRSTFKFVRAAPKHRRIGDKSWLRTIALPGPSIRECFTFFC